MYFSLEVVGVREIANCLPLIFLFNKWYLVLKLEINPHNDFNSLVWFGYKALWKKICLGYNYLTNHWDDFFALLQNIAMYGFIQH